MNGLNVQLAMATVGAEVADGDGQLGTKTSIDIVREARVVAVVGSRAYPEIERVAKLVDLLHSDTILISGGAEGVDIAMTAAGLATRRPVVEFKPIGTGKKEWTVAAFARNRMLALAADVVCAFWDGESKGTADTIRHAMAISGKCVVALPGRSPEVWVTKIL